MRILLADDHVLFRDGLAGLLAPQPDMTIVGQASSVREAVILARKLRPDVVLMDISMMDGSGVEATRMILAERPETKIVILTVHDDDEHLFDAIRAGAMGYLPKSIRAAELIERLRGVARGEAGLSPAFARRILSEFSRSKPVRRPNQSDWLELTERELDIVRLLAADASNRVIAQQLGISEYTVKNHVHNILAKLNLRSRHDVSSYALEHGLLSPPYLPPD